MSAISATCIVKEELFLIFVFEYTIYFIYIIRLDDAQKKWDNLCNKNNLKFAKSGLVKV